MDEDAVIDVWRQFEENAVYTSKKMHNNFSSDLKTFEAFFENKENNFSNVIEKVQTNISNLRDCNLKNVDYLDELEQESETIKKNNSKTRKQIENLENQIKKLNSKLEEKKERNEELKNLKDIILTYKLLTLTNLVYNSNILEGYVTGKEKDYFQIDPKKTPSEEIPKIVWKIVKSVNASQSSE